MTKPKPHIPLLEEVLQTLEKGDRSGKWLKPERYKSPSTQTTPTVSGALWATSYAAGTSLADIFGKQMIMGTRAMQMNVDRALFEQSTNSTSLPFQWATNTLTNDTSR